MKWFWLSAILLFFTGAVCNKPAANCFKGRLVIKGICMNYVIQVVEGNTAALQLEQRWTDETDNKTYTNVFGLSSKCNFPDLAEGAEFYFTLDPQAATDCPVCQAFRPVPAARNSIRVLPAPCP